MAAKKTAEGFEFLVQALKANKGALYSDLKERADKRGLTVFPVMFGRAKAMLGLVKSAKRGQGNAAKKAAGKAAGPRGRPRDGSSKSGQVRELLKAGLSAAEIARKVGCSVNLVYAVKAGVKRAGGRPMGRRGPGRPPKSMAAAGGGSIDAVITALRDADRDRDRTRRAIDQIRSIIDNLSA
jgi:hypothetical protein